ncbi:MAG: hypothetical protein RJA15_1180, partial [Actinomycetota bacterium]
MSSKDVNKIHSAVATPSIGGWNVPVMPRSWQMFGRLLLVVSVLVVVLLIDGASGQLLNYWLLESMGFQSVFWTNFIAQAWLFAIAGILTFVSVAAPTFFYDVSSDARRGFLWVGLLLGLLHGFWISHEYLEFLLPTGLEEFGRTDPIYGLDASFYVFELEPTLYSVETLLLISLAGLISSFVCSSLSRAGDSEGSVSLSKSFRRFGSWYTMLLVLIAGAATAYWIWLGRYQLMFKENFHDSTEGSGRGPEYVDVVGFFSYKNAYAVEALAVLIFGAGVVYLMWSARVRREVTRASIAVVFLVPLALDVTFRSVTAARDYFFVLPNEPEIQLPFIQAHIDATRFAFDLEKVEERTFTPRSGSDPLPDFERLMSDPAIENAPLWPGSVARYGRRVTPQYVQRILEAEGDMTVYAPSLEILNAQEAIRPYYGFLDVDTIGVPVNGKPTMVASAVRELPQDISRIGVGIFSRPWLEAWGQRSFVLTHGHGLVTMTVAGGSADGDPVYTSGGLPSKSEVPLLATTRNAIYYGEGFVEPAFSNAVGVKENGISTGQDRAEVEYPTDVKAGITMDSLLKRVVIGYETGEFVNTFFSAMIADSTRVHVVRRPLERVQAVAPFLAVDLDPYAIPADGGIYWMVNAVSSSQYYPYSGTHWFGTWADLDTELRPHVEMNYVRDAVKVSIDAMTGQVTFYKWLDEPVINTWASIYPDLFKSAAEMPADIKANIQYPIELMNLQFNEVYPYYHQKDAMTFFSSEDLFDDADEIVGPMRGISNAITFTQSLTPWMATPGGALPESQEDFQFVLSKTWTPQDPLNLRAIGMVYQYGRDYGKLSVLKLPKDLYFLGPEQADAIIDQDPVIAQEFGLWNRIGVEVIRGRTSNLIIDGELIYVEPIFIRSRQNPVPKLEKVAVVLRDRAFLGSSLEAALKAAYEANGAMVNQPATLVD